jgi:hypothetical protein
VSSFAPRLPDSLWRAVQEVDDGVMAVAEVHRRVGVKADELGVTRPSYQTVRRVLAVTREWKKRPTTTDVLLDVAFQARPVGAILDHVSGVGVEPLPEDAM